MMYPCKFGEIPHIGSRPITATKSGTTMPMLTWMPALMGSALKPMSPLTFGGGGGGGGGWVGGGNICLPSHFGGGEGGGT